MARFTTIGACLALAWFAATAGRASADVCCKTECIGMSIATITCSIVGTATDCTATCETCSGTCTPDSEICPEGMLAGCTEMEGNCVATCEIMRSPTATERVIVITITPTPTTTPTITQTPTITATPTPVPQGGTCATPSQCSTGFCVDSVCCDTACTDPIMRCNLAGQVGTCASTAAEAPTLTPWGLIAAMVLLAGTAAFAIRRRAR